MDPTVTVSNNTNVSMSLWAKLFHCLKKFSNYTVVAFAVVLCCFDLPHTTKTQAQICPSSI